MQSKPNPSGTTPQPSRPQAAPRIASSDLLGPAGTLVIVHQGREYLLRVTQNGRLILTA